MSKSDLKLVDAAAPDFGNIKLRRRDLDMVQGDISLVEAGKIKINSGPAYTLIRPSDNEVVFISGISILREGVGEAWFLASELMYRYPHTVHRKVLGKILEITKKYNLERLQTTVEFGFCDGEKWLLALGFRHEGLLQKYVEGRDHLMMARIRGESWAL